MFCIAVGQLLSYLEGEASSCYSLGAASWEMEADASSCRAVGRLGVADDLKGSQVGAQRVAAWVLLNLDLQLTC